ncbi:hypothetical protein AAMO2058_001193000 [Amorphochlora amoebiformis]
MTDSHNTGQQIPSKTEGPGGQGDSTSGSPVGMNRKITAKKGSSLKEPLMKSPDGKWVRTNKKLGSGSFKSVYLAIEKSGSEVAWNVIKLGRMGPAQKKKVKQEVEILNNTDHKNIIKFFDHWEMNQRLYFITEKASATLKNRIEELHPVEISTIRGWCIQILNALSYLHDRAENPIIHRDLKPDNVFVASDGTIRLGDFGLAIVTTKNSSISGTPAFMAPEIWTSSTYDSKVDVYAFGMLMLEMKTNQTPYAEYKTLFSDRANGRKIPPPASLDSKNFDIEPKTMNNRMRTVIMSCLEWKPADRPTAQDLLKYEFFHPKLFEITDCKVTFTDKGNLNVVTLALETNVKSSRITEFSIDLRTESVREIAKQYAEAFEKEIKTEYPDSVEQDIADIIYLWCKKKIKAAQKDQRLRDSVSHIQPTISKAKSDDTITPITPMGDIPRSHSTTARPAPTIVPPERIDNDPQQTPTPTSKRTTSPTRRAWDIADFKIQDIKVRESDAGVSAVRFSVFLDDGGKTKQIDREYIIGQDISFRVAQSILQELRNDLDIELFPKHVETLAAMMNESLKEHREVFTKRKEIDQRIGLEELLNKAGITDEKVMKTFVEQAIQVTDLVDGTLPEEDLKDLLPQLGHRRRLIRIAQEELKKVYSEGPGSPASASTKSLSQTIPPRVLPPSSLGSIRIPARGPPVRSSVRTSAAPQESNVQSTAFVTINGIENQPAADTPMSTTGSPPQSSTTPRSNSRSIAESPSTQEAADRKAALAGDSPSFERSHTSP